MNDPYTNIDTLTDKYIDQGYSEDTALEMAANECQEIDEETERLQWD